MINIIEQLNSFSLQLLILISVISIKAILAKFIDVKPLFLFSLYCQRLANKVNKPQHSKKQKQLSGLIALLITILPTATILWLFADFIMVPWLWSALLLFIAIGEFNLGASSKEIAYALKAKQKQFAKEKLKPLVLRNVDQLSTMGLCKATIEMHLLRYVQHYFMISFYFIFVGPLAALLVRLLLEMHYCWNKKQPSFTAFGQAISTTMAILQWLPVRLLALILLLSNISYNFRASVTTFTHYFFQLKNDIVLAIFALSIDRQLSGVAMYEQQKLYKVSFNSSAKPPSIDDIIKTATIIQQISYFCLAILVILSITTHFLY